MADTFNFAELSRNSAKMSLMGVLAAAFISDSVIILVKYAGPGA